MFYPATGVLRHWLPQVVCHVILENKHLPAYSIRQHKQVSHVLFDSARYKYLEELVALNDETIRHDFGFVSFLVKTVQKDSLQTWHKIQGSAVIQ